MTPGHSMHSNFEQEVNEAENAIKTKIYFIGNGNILIARYYQINKKSE